MVKVKYLKEEDVDYGLWLYNALQLAYSTDLVPEQKLVPFNKAYEELQVLVEGCDMVVVANGSKEYAVCCLAYSQESHHVVGLGTVIQSMISNSPPLTRRLLSVVKGLAKSVPEKQSWMYLTKRVGRYAYKGQYYELRN
jgi:hypothetical protein